MIKIDKEFESLIPPLSEDEFRQLEENCVKEGIRDALVVWKVPNGDQILIDGHNRWKISAKHGDIPFQIKEMKFNLREEAIAWIIRNQFGRRNLSAYDRSVLALKLKPIIAEQAEERMKAGKKDPDQKSGQGKTDRQLAKVAGVSHDTIHKVEVIENSGREDIKQAVKAGDMSINQGYRDVKGLSKTNRQAQKEFVDSVKQEREDFKEQKSEGVVSFEDAVRDKENAEFLAQELYRRCMRLGSQIDAFYMEVNEKDVKLAEELKPLPETDMQRLRWQFGSWRNKLLKLEGDLIE
jgi:polyhydroxyalkanoate synthesis regulator phasin